MLKSDFLISNSTVNYGKNGRESYRDVLYDNSDFNSKLRERIKRVLDERIKGGIGYYESLLGEKARKRAIRSRRKKLMKDDSAEFMRRHKGGKKAYKKNKWLKFLNQYRKKHPTLKGRIVMMEASKEYRNL